MPTIKCLLCYKDAVARLIVLDGHEFIVIQWDCNCHQDEEIHETFESMYESELRN